MKRRNSEPISDVLSQFLRQEGLETPLAEHRAIAAWPEVAGEAVAAVTEHVEIHGQTMLVRLTSPVVRHELMMRRDILLKKLNEAAGATILYELRLA